CSNPAKANGASCNDNNACTQTDSCQAGVCAGGNPVTCLALDQCHDVGVCDMTSGTCSNPTKPDGTSCNDNSACTTADSCHAGACTGAMVACDDGDPCTADTCIASSGCQHGARDPICATTVVTLTIDPAGYGGSLCLNGVACIASGPHGIPTAPGFYAVSS